MDEHGQQQNHIDHELTRAVDKLADAFHLVKEVFSDNQKRYEALSHQIRKDQEKENRRQRRDAWLIAMISIVGIGSSIIAASYWSYQQEKVALRKTQISALYNEAHSVQRRINDELKIRDTLMDAMVNVRGVRDFGQRQCSNGRYSGENPILYTQQLYASSYALVGAAYKTYGIFDDKIQSKIQEFVNLSSVDSVGICEKQAPKDKDLRPIQSQVNALILESLNKLQQKKKSLYEELEKTGEAQE